ncbi:MAG: glycosyltransferase family 2 protein [Pseudomonadota bacterium]
MRDLTDIPPPGRFTAAFLRAAVHWDALRAQPASYARAVWWRIRGKKLRARMTLAPLLGQSPRAYRLWRARRGPLKAPSNGEPRSVLALVEPGDGAEQTLASCAAEGIAAAIVADLSQLADLLAGEETWVLPLEAGTQLARGAGAFLSAATVTDETTHVIYADDDLIAEDGTLTSPHFKPDWNAELFQHCDYLTGSALLRKKALSPSDRWLTDLTHQAITACTANSKEPMHLRHVLFHRRARPAPQLPLPPVTIAKRDEPFPKISVLVPTRNRLDLLRVCLRGLMQTEYPGALDIIVIDNGSDDPETLEYLSALDEEFARVIRDEGAFNFAALNNRAAARAEGELLCFLNNDIEVIEPDWLTTMAQQAQRDEIGAVGARLLYPNGMIQHAGVVLGIGGAAAHAHRTLHPDEEGYFHRHSLPHFASAVTAACMVVRRDRFEAVGGFDEDRFAVSFNDVDLCCRLAQRGWKTLYEPRATLVHHESVSRGLDRDAEGAARQAREVATLQERWSTGLAPARQAPKSADPFHHPELSRLSEQFVIRL